jgi:hypothetical protein
MCFLSKRRKLNVLGNRGGDRRLTRSSRKGRRIHADRDP